MVRQARPALKPYRAVQPKKGTVPHVAPSLAHPALSSEVRIGAKLRHARLRRELSLKELAEKVGCSVSALSKIEGQKANPSINMLHKICSALDTNLAELFSTEDGPTVVTRSAERPRIETDQVRRGTGILLERLVPYSTGYLLQGNVHVIEPGGGSEQGLIHEGEEVGYVIEGQLELVVDGNTYLAAAGDSFFFRSNLPHSYRNPGETVTRVVWVNTPPTF
jgi:transcriptional regulator with XRE-family HTH domain